MNEHATPFPNDTVRLLINTIINTNTIVTDFHQRFDKPVPEPRLYPFEPSAPFARTPPITRGAFLPRLLFHIQCVRLYRRAQSVAQGIKRTLNEAIILCRILEEKDPLEETRVIVEIPIVRHSVAVNNVLPENVHLARREPTAKIANNVSNGRRVGLGISGLGIDAAH